MDNYYHRTNNLHSILSSGRIKALKHLAKDSPDLQLEVEPYKNGLNVGGYNSYRKNLSASEAYNMMKGVKDVDNIFLTKEVLPPSSYGKYIIEKNLKSAKESSGLNLIPNEHTTGRSLSVNSNARVYVPDEEHDDLSSKFNSVNFIPMSELKARQANLADHARSLYGKLTKSADINTLYSGSESDIRKLLSPNATIVGSEGLGINLPGASDRDILVPYKTRSGYNRLEQSLRDNGFGLQESKYNDRKRDGYKVYSYKDDKYDVDVALVHGGKSIALADKVRQIRNDMTDERRKEIVDNKDRLSKAWFFRDYRYKNYKRKIDEELGLKEFHE